MKDHAILIHCCCAHCTAYTVEFWRDQGYKISAFWYNPNIHPFKEHQHRMEAMKKLAEKLEFLLILNGEYDVTAYFKRVVGNEERRCAYCFRIRLKKTAEMALRYGFNAYTSSLLISPHQEHDLLHGIGSDVSEETGMEFLDNDLRKYYSQSRCITKPLGLYTQKYCGCIYSKWERFPTERKKNNV